MGVKPVFAYAYFCYQAYRQVGGGFHFCFEYFFYFTYFVFGSLDNKFVVYLKDKP